MPDDFLGHTSQEHVLQTCAPVRAHDNQIRAQLRGFADDGISGITRRHLGLPGTPKISRDQIA
jgi:hypothetical protein